MQTKRHDEKGGDGEIGTGEMRDTREGSRVTEGRANEDRDEWKQ